MLHLLKNAEDNNTKNPWFTTVTTTTTTLYTQPITVRARGQGPGWTAWNKEPLAPIASSYGAGATAWTHTLFYDTQIQHIRQHDIHIPRPSRKQEHTSASKGLRTHRIPHVRILVLVRVPAVVNAEVDGGRLRRRELAERLVERPFDKVDHRSPRRARVACTINHSFPVIGRGSVLFCLEFVDHTRHRNYLERRGRKNRSKMQMKSALLPAGRVKAGRT